MPLPFVGSTHEIRYNYGSAPSIRINATELSTGTTPAGSTWRRNPIPGCNCDIGGGNCVVGGKGFNKAYENRPDPLTKEVCPTGTMFPAQFKNGAGDVGYLTGHPLHYSIVDTVRVPKTEGRYILQWRWDCEETNQVCGTRARVTVTATHTSHAVSHCHTLFHANQVWNSCADIKISSTEPPTPPPSPAPPAPPVPPKPTPSGKGVQGVREPDVQDDQPRQVRLHGLQKVPRRHDVRLRRMLRRLHAYTEAGLEHPLLR